MVTRLQALKALIAVPFLAITAFGRPSSRQNKLQKRIFATEEYDQTDEQKFRNFMREEMIGLSNRLDEIERLT